MTGTGIGIGTGIGTGERRVGLPTGELRERYLRAQLAGDRREAVRLVLEEGVDRGASVVELQSDVIQAAQDEIGRLWQLNLVTIAQEHMATAISQLALSALFQHAPARKAHGKKIAIACVEGEQHDLPARLVADYLELDGFEVRYFGANVPQDELGAMIRDESPDVIGLSVTMSFNMPALREAISRLRTITTAPILVGGHAVELSRQAAAALGVELAGKRPDELCAAVRRLAGVA
ncbi:MAG TPA: cobalamin-dependent protein [Kofleriaceae bacterium]|nr:cobalamin-dependent protein [Kofleriaceae bacterium]